MTVKLSSVVTCRHLSTIVCAQVSRSGCVMTTQVISKLLKSKEASAVVDLRSWPPVLDTGEGCVRNV